MAVTARKPPCPECKNLRRAIARRDKVIEVLRKQVAPAGRLAPAAACVADLLEMVRQEPQFFGFVPDILRDIARTEVGAVTQDEIKRLAAAFRAQAERIRQEL